MTLDNQKTNDDWLLRFNFLGDKDYKKLMELEKTGKVSPDVVALLETIGLMANTKIGNTKGSKNKEAILSRSDYDRIKNLDNSVFDKADLYIGKEHFTIIDKITGTAYNFNYKLNVGKNSEVKEKCSDKIILGSIIDAYLADGGLSKEDIEKISKADAIIDNTTVMIGSENITIISDGANTWSIKAPKNGVAQKFQR